MCVYVIYICVYPGNALFGLQSMTSTAPEVPPLLTALTKQLKKNQPDQFTFKDVSNCLLGLRGLGGMCAADSVEVRALLQSLVHKIHLGGGDATSSAGATAETGAAGVASEVVAGQVLSRTAFLFVL